MSKGEKMGKSEGASPWYKNRKYVVGVAGGALVLCIGVGAFVGSRGTAEPVVIDTQTQEEAAEGGKGLGTEEVAKASEVWQGYSDYPGNITGVKYPDNEFGLKAFEALQAEFNLMVKAYDPDGTADKPYPVGLSASYNLADVNVTTVSNDGNNTVGYIDVLSWGALGESVTDFELTFEDGSVELLSATENVNVTGGTEQDGAILYQFTFDVDGSPAVGLKVIGPGVAEGRGHHDLVRYYVGTTEQSGPDWNAWVADKYSKLLAEAGISEAEAEELPTLSGESSGGDEIITLEE